MKKTFFIALLSLGFISNAQIGINTSNPQNTFHLDGAKDNPVTGTPSVLQQSNDFIVTSEGNVGIGITSPAAKLDVNNGAVNGAVKIVDGTQGEGRVLTSDANGIGTWRNSTVTNVTGVTPTVNTPYGTQLINI